MTLSFNHGSDAFKDLAFYSVISNRDRTEGRGEEYVIALCESKETAKRLGKGNYVQGTDCEIRTVYTTTINGVRYLPLSAIRIEPPTKVDLESEEAQRKFDRMREITEKILALGIPREDLAMLISGNS